MSYQIADEPVESNLAAYAVRPAMPLLAIMVAGAWLSWPWFAFNAYALGSPTRRREVGLVIAAFVATALLAGLWVLAIEQHWITTMLWARLWLVAIVAVKLTLTKLIEVTQQRTFHVYEYYGGAVMNPTRILGAGALTAKLVVGLFAHPIWIIVMS